MEKGAKVLAYMLALAGLLGALVIAVNPAYRKAAVSIWKGHPEESPIWRSNFDYYPDIDLSGPEGAGDAE